MAYLITLKSDWLKKVQSAGGTEYHFRVSIHDFVEANGNQEHCSKWKFLLAANVRNPVSNKVTESIVQSLKESPDTTISSPIHIAADCRVRESRERGNTVFLVEIVMGGIYLTGVLDGGHRILGSIQSYNMGLDLKNAFLNLVVYSGYSDDFLRKKAVALNTSRAVSAMSLANYLGNFDWMKERLQPYQIAYFEGQFGKHNNRTHGCCTITRICQLLLVLDNSYDPREKVLGKNDHPIYAVKTGNIQSRKDFVGKIGRLFSLVDDAIDIQDTVFTELDGFHSRSKTKKPLFTQNIKHEWEATMLPSGKSLSCVVTKHSFVFPIVSAFRVFVVTSPETGVSTIALSTSERKKLAMDMLYKYFALIPQAKYAGQSALSFSQNVRVWNEMYAIALEYLQSKKEDAV
jgi:hypothetical protein